MTATQSGLTYSYDDNGNMIKHIGDTYTWDFNDRLIKTVTANTTADYVYDYAGKRVIKKAQTGTNQDVAYYINEAYEVRAGVTEKYVFAGDRRVARISVRQDSGNSQPLSFHQGWNFFSLDVEPANPAIAAVFSPLSGITYEVWQFDATTQTYKGYVPAQGITDLKEIHARIGYIIKVSAAAYMTISGSQSTASTDLAQGWNLIGCPVDSPMLAAAALSSIAGKYSEVWEYEGTEAGWQGYLPQMPTYLSSLDTMRPGSAYWIKMNQAAPLTFQQQNRQINFFHPDHLGSSSVVTDVYGAVVESTEFYPYGRPRYEERTTFNSSYKYTGKELDKESGLMYYGARYYDSVVGKFVSVDPMNQAPEKIIGNTFGSQGYLYARANPLMFVDPTGMLEVLNKLQFAKGEYLAPNSTYKIQGQFVALERKLSEFYKTPVALRLQANGDISVFRAGDMYNKPDPNAEIAVIKGGSAAPLTDKALELKKWVSVVATKVAPYVAATDVIYGGMNDVASSNDKRDVWVYDGKKVS